MHCKLYGTKLGKKIQENVHCTCLITLTRHFAFYEFKQTQMKHNICIITSNPCIYGFESMPNVQVTPQKTTTNNHKVHASTITHQMCAIKCIFIILVYSRSLTYISIKYLQTHLTVDISQSHLVAQHFRDLGYTFDLFLGLSCML